MTSPTRITSQSLSSLIGRPDCPVLVDVSIDEDYACDPFLIPSAFRFPADRIVELLPYVENRDVVVICQKGMKLSAGAAALLRIQGVNARNLEGGNIDWREQGLVRVPGTFMKGSVMKNPSQWVVRRDVDLATLACAWLVRRFVNRDAHFLFVEQEDVIAVSEKFSAHRFCAEGGTTGEDQSIDPFLSLLVELSLETDALSRFASLIADGSDNHHCFQRLFFGLSRMCKDNLQQLEHGVMLFDALYQGILLEMGGENSMLHSRSNSELGYVAR